MNDIPRPEGVKSFMLKRINIAREGSGIVVWQDYTEVLSYISQLERELHESRLREERLRGAANKLMEASRIYFEQYGAEHEEGCPEDDTCNCEKTMPLSLAFANMAIALSTTTPADMMVPCKYCLKPECECNDEDVSPDMGAK